MAQSHRAPRLFLVRAPHSSRPFLRPTAAPASARAALRDGRAGLQHRDGLFPGRAGAGGARPRLLAGGDRLGVDHRTLGEDQFRGGEQVPRVWWRRSTCRWRRCIGRGFWTIQPCRYKSNEMASRWRSMARTSASPARRRGTGGRRGGRASCANARRSTRSSSITRSTSASARCARRPERGDLTRITTRCGAFSPRRNTFGSNERPGVKLGVVFPSDPEFWKRGAKIVDVAHPFLFVNDEANVPQDAAGRVRAQRSPARPARVLSGEGDLGRDDKVSPERLAEFDRAAIEAGLPYFVWTYDTLFNSKLYDPEAVVRALKLGWASVSGPGPRVPRSRRPPAPRPQNRRPRGTGPTRRRTLSAFPPTSFSRGMAKPLPEYEFFADMHALIQKAKDSDTKERGGSRAGGASDAGPCQPCGPALSVLLRAERGRRCPRGAASDRGAGSRQVRIDTCVSRRKPWAILRQAAQRTAASGVAQGPRARTRACRCRKSSRGGLVRSQLQAELPRSTELAPNGPPVPPPGPNDYNG